MFRIRVNLQYEEYYLFTFPAMSVAGIQLACKNFILGFWRLTIESPRAPLSPIAMEMNVILCGKIFQQCMIR